MDSISSLNGCEVRRSGKSPNRVIVTTEMEFSTHEFEQMKEVVSTLTPPRYFANAIMRSVRNDLKRQRRFRKGQNMNMLSDIAL